MDWNERINRQPSELRSFLKDALDLFDVIGRFDRHPVSMRLTGKQSDGSRFDLSQGYPKRPPQEKETP